MKLRLFGFVFFAAFFIEVASIIVVGRQVGVLWTLLLLFLGMVIGGSLIAKSGRDMITQVQVELAAGRNPDQQMVKGLITFFAGVLLFIPGFVTDTLAIILLIPFVQTQLLKFMKNYTKLSTKYYADYRTTNPNNYSSSKDDEIIIDLDSDEYHSENEKKRDMKYISNTKNDDNLR
ncbi:FxsA family protein [Bartonella sp. HY329]|uniref:FxsA family protein n=1 Tax=unclassified Bartonella TaxID=2645622 RepID=UPI0021C81FF5|nr:MULTISPECIES: FxsA family protein [unclassified Bartonella]UXM94847.1 FxsA family protein [Bartonella sp. HY329]UXN09170.1 FxsA family protein [Bartonella sp. HY328]